MAAPFAIRKRNVIDDIMFKWLGAYRLRKCWLEAMVVAALAGSLVPEEAGAVAVASAAKEAVSLAAEGTWALSVAVSAAEAEKDLAAGVVAAKVEAMGSAAGEVAGVAAGVAASWVAEVAGAGSAADWELVADSRLWEAKALVGTEVRAVAALTRGAMRQEEAGEEGVVAGRQAAEVGAVVRTELVIAKEAMA